MPIFPSKIFGRNPSSLAEKGRGRTGKRAPSCVSLYVSVFCAAREAGPLSARPRHKRPGSSKKRRRVGARAPTTRRNWRARKSRMQNRGRFDMTHEARLSGERRARCPPTTSETKPAVGPRGKAARSVRKPPTRRHVACRRASTES